MQCVEWTRRDFNPRRQEGREKKKENMRCWWFWRAKVNDLQIGHPNVVSLP